MGAGKMLRCIFFFRLLDIGYLLSHLFPLFSELHCEQPLSLIFLTPEQLCFREMFVKSKLQTAKVSGDRSAGRRGSTGPLEGREDEETNGVMDAERAHDESHIERESSQLSLSGRGGEVLILTVSCLMGFQ